MAAQATVLDQLAARLAAAPPSAPVKARPVSGGGARAAFAPGADADDDESVGGDSVASDISVPSGTYVPNYENNPHARAVNESGDVYERPQLYSMYRDATYDKLATKPNGTLYQAYRSVEPGLRYMWNAIEYLKETVGKHEEDDPIGDRLEAAVMSLHGAYSLINRYVGTIHLRAHFGDSMAPREKQK